ncbi:hypothetical protein PRIPAC_85983, partial [Pristionchus pacificus]|uniref:Uncharacterized protein n=1 Tax=Pristionchus pacificus TaxID=54126 RepID=A0A2A6BNX4_PRIPA
DLRRIGLFGLRGAKTAAPPRGGVDTPSPLAQERYLPFRMNGLKIEGEGEARRKRSSSIHAFSCRPSTSNGTATPPVRPNRLFIDNRFESPARDPSRRASASGALHLDTSGRRLRFRMGGHTYTME